MQGNNEEEKIICKYCGSDKCMEISVYSLHVCRECGKLFEVENERD